MTELPSEYGPRSEPTKPAATTARTRWPLRAFGWTLCVGPFLLLLSNPAMWILAFPALVPFVVVGAFILMVAAPKAVS